MRALCKAALLAITQLPALCTAPKVISHFWHMKPWLLFYPSTQTVLAVDILDIPLRRLINAELFPLCLSLFNHHLSFTTGPYSNCKTAPVSILLILCFFFFCLCRCRKNYILHAKYHVIFKKLIYRSIIFGTEAENCPK